MNPLVSVIIPTYNRAKILPRAIDSALAQGDIPLEIIVVDDGSADDTGEMLRRRYPQVRYEDQGRAGPSAARNLGMRMARGEFIAFLDSDDEWEAGSLAIRVAVLQQHRDVDVVFSDFVDVVDGLRDERSFLETRTQWENMHIKWRDAHTGVPAALFACQLVEPMLQTSTVVLRRAALAAGEAFDDGLWRAEDWEFFVRLASRHTFAVVNRVLVLRHIQGDNMTRIVKEAWFNAGIEVDRCVLRRCPLTAAQARFLRDRIGDNLFDWAYYLCWQTGNTRAAARRALESLRWRPMAKTAKLLAVTLLPASLIRRLRRGGRGNSHRTPETT